VLAARCSRPLRRLRGCACSTPSCSYEFLYERSGDFYLAPGLTITASGQTTVDRAMSHETHQETGALVPNQGRRVVRKLRVERPMPGGLTTFVDGASYNDRWYTMPSLTDARDFWVREKCAMETWS
jgi:hypothetical protein